MPHPVHPSPSPPAYPSPAELRTAFTLAAKPDGRAWPDHADFADFDTAGRVCGRAPLVGLPGWTCEDAGRVLALAELAARRPDTDMSARLRTLYWRGDTHQRRAVVRALSYPAIAAGDTALASSLIEDALLGDDPGLVAAAMGPCAAALDDAAWRRGVLKCATLGLPLRRVVTALDERADTELARGLADFAARRRAAGGSVAADVSALAARAAVTAAEH